MQFVWVRRFQTLDEMLSDAVLAALRFDTACRLSASARAVGKGMDV